MMQVLRCALLALVVVSAVRVDEDPQAQAADEEPAADAQADEAAESPQGQQAAEQGQAEEPAAQQGQAPAEGQAEEAAGQAAEQAASEAEAEDPEGPIEDNSSSEGQGEMTEQEKEQEEARALKEGTAKARATVLHYAAKDLEDQQHRAAVAHGNAKRHARSSKPKAEESAYRAETAINQGARVQDRANKATKEREEAEETARLAESHAKFLKHDWEMEEVSLEGAEMAHMDSAKKAQEAADKKKETHLKKEAAVKDQAGKKKQHHEKAKVAVEAIQKAQKSETVLLKTKKAATQYKVKHEHAKKRAAHHQERVDEAEGKSAHSKRLHMASQMASHGATDAMASKTAKAMQTMMLSADTKKAAVDAANMHLTAQKAKIGADAATGEAKNAAAEEATPHVGPLSGVESGPEATEAQAETEATEEAAGQQEGGEEAASQQEGGEEAADAL